MCGLTSTSSGGGYDFGELRQTTTHPASASNNTRGIVGGGYNPTPIYWDKIEFFTIATTGSSVEFGNLTDVRWYAGGGRASTTRMLFIAGATPSSVSVIDYIEIATKGNAVDFGNTSGGLKGYGMGCGNASSTTRTVTLGGYYDPADVNTIHYLTFATKGDSIDFGDLTATTRGGGSTSSQTRGLLAGGRTPTQVNTIQYITIASTGKATHFGDSTRIVAFNNAGLSDCHGGIG